MTTKYFDLDAVHSPEFDEEQKIDLLRMYQKRLQKNRINTRDYRVVVASKDMYVYIGDFKVGSITSVVKGSTKKTRIQSFESACEEISINNETLVKFMLVHLMPRTYDSVRSILDIKMVNEVSAIQRDYDTKRRRAADGLDPYEAIHKFVMESESEEFTVDRALSIFKPITDTDYFHYLEQGAKYSKFIDNNGWYVLVEGQGEGGVVIDTEHKTITKVRDEDPASTLPPEAMIKLRTLQVTGATHHDSGVLVDVDTEFKENLHRSIYFILK